jgi:DNA-directed RNA polymerase sigma subunit (sigma70/sigma32)
MKIVLTEKPIQQDKTSELIIILHNSNSPLKIPPLIRNNQEISLRKMIALINFSHKGLRKKKFLLHKSKGHTLDKISQITI